METTRDIKILKNKLKNELLLHYYRNVHAQILPLEKLRFKLLIGTVIVYTIIFALLYYYLIYNDVVKFLFSEKLYGALIFIVIIIYNLVVLPIKGLSIYYREKLKKL